MELYQVGICTVTAFAFGFSGSDVSISAPEGQSVPGEPEYPINWPHVEDQDLRRRLGDQSHGQVC